MEGIGLRMSAKHRKGSHRQAMKEGGGGGGSFVARTIMQDIASLTDAGVIVIVNNTQLDAAVQALFPKRPPSCTQKSYNRRRDVSRT